MILSLLFTISFSNPDAWHVAHHFIQRRGPDLYFLGHVLNWVRSMLGLFDDLGGVRVGWLSAWGTPNPASTVEGNFLLSHLVILWQILTIFDHYLCQVTCRQPVTCCGVVGERRKGLLPHVKKTWSRALGTFYNEDAFFPPPHVYVCAYVWKHVNILRNFACSALQFSRFHDALGRLESWICILSFCFPDLWLIYSCLFKCLQSTNLCQRSLQDTKCIVSQTFTDIHRHLQTTHDYSVWWVTEVQPLLLKSQCSGRLFSPH